MKQFLFVIVMGLAILSCTEKKQNKVSQQVLDKIAADTLNYTTIEWLDTAQNFGVVKMGEKVTVRFRFKNTGTKPLRILEVHPACGCTTADYTTESVDPNNEGYVTAIYNSENQPHGGIVRKSLTVVCNTKNTKEHLLQFGGEVLVDGKPVEPVKTN